MTSPRVSKSFERGLANWPAMRPTFTTGKLEWYCRTAAICKIVLMRLRIESAVAAANVSAQSPPCNQNARPAAASATFAFKSSHSPAKTSGGNDFRSATAFFTLSPSTPPGHCGCCAATSPGVKRFSSEVVMRVRVVCSDRFSGENYPKKISDSL